MLILKMLLRITNFTQGELASFLDVSRASLNSWLSDDSTMSISSKTSIANIFQFPVSYFDIDLDQDMSLYRVVFSSLSNSWNRIKNENFAKQYFTTDDKINEILNNLEFDFYSDIEHDALSDEEIIEGLAGGFDPFTGEVFNENHILSIAAVKKIMNRLKKNYSYIKNNCTKEDLSDYQLKIFEKLRVWRKNKSEEEGHYKPYLVCSDKDLVNIILADIEKKEDLRYVTGMGARRYDKYADDIISILMDEDNDFSNFFEDPFKDFVGEVSLTDDDLPF